MAHLAKGKMVRLDPFLSQDFARSDVSEVRCVCFHVGLVIIDNFDPVSVLFVPAKADAPLVIDTDTMLSTPAALQCFQMVAGRQAHDLQPIGGVELEEFSAARALNVWWQSARRCTAEDFLRLGIGETFDHARKLAGL